MYICRHPKFLPHNLVPVDLAMMTVTAVLALLGVTSVAAMYGGTDVVDLTPTNFQREVMKSDNVWIVEFYAPW